MSEVAAPASDAPCARAAAKAYKKKVAARAAADVARAKEEVAAVQADLQAVRQDLEAQQATSLAHEQGAQSADARAADALAQLVRKAMLCNAHVHYRCSTWLAACSVAQTASASLRIAFACTQAAAKHEGFPGNCVCQQAAMISITAILQLSSEMHAGRSAAGTGARSAGPARAAVQESRAPAWLV